jgi:hypothetical protein
MVFTPGKALGQDIPKLTRPRSSALGAAILGVAPCPGALPYIEIAIIVNKPSAGEIFLSAVPICTLV